MEERQLALLSRPMPTARVVEKLMPNGELV